MPAEVSPAWLVCKCPARSTSTPLSANAAIAFSARPTSSALSGSSGRSKGWWVTMTLVSDAGSVFSRRRSDSICSSLIRPPLKVSERAVLVPSTAISSSTNDGSRLPSTCRLYLPSGLRKRSQMR
jgi:hypothetical protein